MLPHQSEAAYDLLYARRMIVLPHVLLEGSMFIAGSFDGTAALVVAISRSLSLSYLPGVPLLLRAALSLRPPQSSCSSGNSVGIFLEATP